MVDLYKWANYEEIGIEFFDHYFDWTTGEKGIHHLESLTRMYLPEGMEKQFIEPDGAFILETPKGRKLYLFELHRGYGADRVLEQLRTYQVVLRKGLAMEKYQFERNSRVIVLFEKRATQRLVLERLTEEEQFEKFCHYFLFKNLEEGALLEVEEFGQGWINGIGEREPIY